MSTDSAPHGTSRPGLERRISTHPRDIDYVRTNIPCQWGCPARTNVPAYIEAIYNDDPTLSYVINRRSNLFPGSLGRICSRPCEEMCRHGDADLGESVAICWLKRVAADFRDEDYPREEYRFSATGKSVGIVGGGPGGLAAAHSLALFGHDVTIYEMMPKLGGMLLYGIPRFRLPDDIIAHECADITGLGVDVETGVKLGEDFQAKDLMERHDAVLVATGCYDPFKLRVPGEDLPQVYSGLEFMMRVNQGGTPEVGDRVAVIGGGFTAMDCSRMSARLGAERVDIWIRETEQDLLVTKEEIHEVKVEGIRFQSLVATTAILGDEKVEGIRFARTKLRTDPETGMKIPQNIPDSEFEVEVDTIITAIGQRPYLEQGMTGLDREVEFDASTGRSTVQGLYAAGDFNGGASTVIEAIAHGRNVAEEIDQDLVGWRRRRKVVTMDPWQDTHRKRAWDFIDRTDMPMIDLQCRFSDPQSEVELGFDKDLGSEESKRCYLCGLKYEIYVPDCIYCRWCIDLCPRDCIHLVEEFEHTESGRATLKKTKDWNKVAAVVIDSDRCIRCGECLRICPTQCISVSQVNLVDQVELGGGGPHGE
jgi:formate dehydrogenase major subunit